MRKRVVGNWKMNGSRQTIAAVLGELGQISVAADVAVCVPYPYVAAATSVLAIGQITVGAQNISEFPEGAYTGEVSGRMLKDMACSSVIIGHSERRRWFHESDESVARKLDKALDAKLFAIVCVGETLAEREAGVTEAVISAQLSRLAGVIGEGDASDRYCIAYEPVWAIGTGRAASEAQIEEVHDFIKRCVGETIQVLYGGSVNAANAAKILHLKNVDGVLVGGASLDAKEFGSICKAAVL